MKPVHESMCIMTVTMVVVFGLLYCVFPPISWVHGTLGMVGFTCIGAWTGWFLHEE